MAKMDAPSRHSSYTVAEVSISDHYPPSLIQSRYQISGAMIN